MSQNPLKVMILEDEISMKRVWNHAGSGNDRKTVEQRFHSAGSLKCQRFVD